VVKRKGNDCRGEGGGQKLGIGKGEKGGQGGGKGRVDGIYFVVKISKGNFN